MINLSRIVNEPVPATPHFNFLHGAFGLGNWRVPYFASTLSFEDAAQYLNLPSEIPGGEEISWSIDALYQRNVDWQRVQRQIVPYLKTPDMPQFFNAVTIALLPYSGKERRIADSFADEYPWSPPQLLKSYEQDLTVGPIRFGFWDPWTSPLDQGFATGQMVWNPREVFAVAIDGQHRLAAIKEIADPMPRDDSTTSRLPVLLLLFDPRVGFVAPGKPPTVELLRRLFIDLNKHAKTVNRARQILLDDRDPCAVSVRALLAPTLEKDLDSLNGSPPCLPLSLVDWFTEQAKFDTGPYVTTVLGLDWTVSHVLDTSSLSDMTAYGRVGGQLAKLVTRLRISMLDAQRRLDALRDQELTPFTYSDTELDLVKDAFAIVWNRPLCRLFTGFSPYAAFISHRKSDDTLSLDWQEWYRLRMAKKDDQFEGRATEEYKRFLGVLQQREHPLGVNTLEDRLSALDNMKRDNLAFNVVFQRALLLGFLDYLKLSEAHISQLRDEYGFNGEESPDFDVDIDESDEDDAELLDELSNGLAPTLDVVSAGNSSQQVFADQNATRADEFIGNMNDLLSVYPEYLDLEAIATAEDVDGLLWAGSLRRPEGGIDFTLSASNRARDIIFLTAAMSTLYRSTGGDMSFMEIWAEVINVAAGSPSFFKAISRAVSHMKRDETALAGRILSARDQTFTFTDAMREVELRLHSLWDKIAESVDGA
jgi:hypothetical protein